MSQKKIDPDMMPVQERMAVSRRDFMKIAGVFGVTSTVMAAAGMAGIITAPSLAKAANSVYEKRFKHPAKYSLKFGGADKDARRLLVNRIGFLDFVRDLEERTDGAMRIEYIGANQICTEMNAVSKAQQGIIDIYGCATQNAAASAPYYNVLDFAYMFPSRASIYHFLFDPRSNALLREPLRKTHKVHFLFTGVEMRNLFMGEKFRDKPLITSIEQLAGTKNRSTGTQLGIIAMKLLGLNPVPVAWEETYDALKQGLVDGQETIANAIPMASMTPVTSQMVGLEFFPGTMHTAMNATVFDKLDAEMQEQMMESAYYTQSYIQGLNEATMANLTGATAPPVKGTEFDKHGVRVSIFSPEEKKKCEEMSAPNFVPEPWEQWRERLNKWAGGIDVYTEIHKIAREIPADMLADNVEPRRWWRS
ncbi:TRAP transporter substrate-binding protein [Desulfovibrio sp. OttesenSCG-928-I05]|nr:TRAP transporter substrate-binding protein [Desulfovibrio sp. OttesenSCG-928-I05]